MKHTRVEYINGKPHMRYPREEALEELVRAAWKCIHSGLSCSECRFVAGGCTLESAMRKLGVVK